MEPGLYQGHLLTHIHSEDIRECFRNGFARLYFHKSFELIHRYFILQNRSLQRIAIIDSDLFD